MTQATVAPDHAPDIASASATPARRPSAFAHASEAELARIFDFYAVRWEYEPHLFPIQWNLEGAVVESFSPDFFLPDFDLYVELTTLRQPLVRKKNRKLRRLRELYPEVRIKLFYARDFRALMLKYGKGALIGALSGTSGQVMPAAEAPAQGERLAETQPAEAPTAAGQPGRPATPHVSAVATSRRAARRRASPRAEGAARVAAPAASGPLAAAEPEA